jgi:HSP20 family protein
MRTQLVPRQRGTLYHPALSQLVENALRDVATGNAEVLGDSPWVPAVDVRETDEALLFDAELPGLSKEDVNLSLENNILTLSGERKLKEKEEKEEKEGYHLRERFFGHFTRAFTLPRNIDTAKTEAHFEAGVLTIKIPKVAAARPKQIAIK